MYWFHRNVSTSFRQGGPFFLECPCRCCLASKSGISSHLNQTKKTLQTETMLFCFHVIQCHTVASLLISFAENWIVGPSQLQFSLDFFWFFLWNRLPDDDEYFGHRRRFWYIDPNASDGERLFVSSSFKLSCKSWTWADKASDKRHHALKEHAVIIWAQTIATMHIPGGERLSGEYKCYAPNECHFRFQLG